MKNKCNSLSKNAKKQYLICVKRGIMNNKKFWSTVKPFRISKGVFAEHQKNIRIEGDIINDKKHLVELFNKHYTNIVKTTSRKKIISSISLGDP